MTVSAPVSASVSASVRARWLDLDARGFVPVWSAWGSAAEIVRARGVWLNAELQRLSDLDWASGFRAAMSGAPGRLDASAFLNRVVAGENGSLLVGIRYAGLSPGAAYVDILAGGEPLGMDDLRRAVAAYPEHDVGRARVFLASGEPLRGWRGRVDQCVLVGCCGEIARADAGAHVGLIDADVDEASAFVAENYAGLQRDEPGLASRLEASGPDELRRCAARGRLAWWCGPSGNRMGLLAVEPSRVLGVCGWVITEEVVGRAYRGQGSASRAQRALAAWLCERGRDALILGTVDGANEASLRTAARAGRRCGGRWWFVELG